MAREPTIPLFLWVATATLAHILWGGGTEQVVRVVEGNTTVSRFAQSIRAHVERTNRTVELELLDETLLVDDVSAGAGAELPHEAEPERPKTPPEQTADEQPTPDREAQEEDDRKESESLEEAKTKRDESAKKKADEKAQLPEEKKDEPEKPREELKPAKLLPMQRRVAVKQHIDDENQKDNPNAEFAADHANHTDKREQAQITATDQNDREPAPGDAHTGPSNDPGNAHVTDIAQADSSPGDPERAFAESPKDGKDEIVQNNTEAVPQPLDPSTAQFGEAEPAAAGIAPGSEHSQFASRGQKPQEALSEREQSPGLIAGEESSHVAAPEVAARAARDGHQGRKHRSAPKGNHGRLPSLRGTQSLSMTPGGLNPNLTSLSALSAIGADQLRKERHADGQRRRSKHRGSFHPQGLERWKASIENYVASVQPGNQTALNTARVPFASYLNRIHQRLHDVFALGFLRSLDSLPNDHSLNRRDLHANLEIVLSREDGRIVRMGVTRASGSTAFDVGALEAVQKASPYGAPPREIVSPDGNVYLHWEFYRDPMNACSTYFARPYILHVSPTPAPIIPPPTRPASPTDREQHGRREQHLDGQGKGG